MLIRATYLRCKAIKKRSRCVLRHPKQRRQWSCPFLCKSTPTRPTATPRCIWYYQKMDAALLMDARGQVAKQVFPRRDLPAGEHLFDLDMHGLPPGMYLLSVQTGQEKHSVRVVKQ
ncbi:MAG: T9SS type A sorting domain-containing protein [Saprospiraceae bacterium]|nr:T9SS type A sorting domain-containing protein [Saprospiraceae bacterium]